MFELPDYKEDVLVVIRVEVLYAYVPLPSRQDDNSFSVN
jgi:hypothetical protein